MSLYCFIMEYLKIFMMPHRKRKWKSRRITFWVKTDRDIQEWAYINLSGHYGYHHLKSERNEGSIPDKGGISLFIVMI